MLHLTRGRDGQRRLSEVAVPLREPSGLVSMCPAVTFDAEGGVREGPGAARLAERLTGRSDGGRSLPPTGEAG